MASADNYKAEFKKDIFGKPPHDVVQAYPEYEHHRQVSKLSSQVSSKVLFRYCVMKHHRFLSRFISYILHISQIDYVKDAEKIKHHHNLPLDYPEFVRAKENAKNASQVIYLFLIKEMLGS